MIGHNRGYAERLDSWISAPHSQCRQASAALKDLVQALQPGELHERAVRCPLPVGLQEHAHSWEQDLQQADTSYNSRLNCSRHPVTGCGTGKGYTEHHMNDDDRRTCCMVQARSSPAS